MTWRFFFSFFFSAYCIIFIFINPTPWFSPYLGRIPKSCLWPSPEAGRCAEIQDARWGVHQITLHSTSLQKGPSNWPLWPCSTRKPAEENQRHVEWDRRARFVYSLTDNPSCHFAWALHSMKEKKERKRKKKETQKLPILNHPRSPPLKFSLLTHPMNVQIWALEPVPASPATVTAPSATLVTFRSWAQAHGSGLNWTNPAARTTAALRAGRGISNASRATGYLCGRIEWSLAVLVI